MLEACGIDFAHCSTPIGLDAAKVYFEYGV